jgi:hypothetical protein
MNGKPATTHTAISGSFESAYTMTQTLQREDIFGGGMTRTTEGTWLGPCAADQKPGDIIKFGDVIKPTLPNGTRPNILDLIKAKTPP